MSIRSCIINKSEDYSYDVRNFWKENGDIHLSIKNCIKLLNELVEKKILKDEDFTVLITDSCLTPHYIKDDKTEILDEKGYENIKKKFQKIYPNKKWYSLNGYTFYPKRLRYWDYISNKYKYYIRSFYKGIEEYSNEDDKIIIICSGNDCWNNNIKSDDLSKWIDYTLLVRKSIKIISIIQPYWDITS
tara:strand:+ start:152 stop:715 length:564 start_codon:yes stop_codon:yes gene_type:complete